MKYVGQFYIWKDNLFVLKYVQISRTIPLFAIQAELWLLACYYHAQTPTQYTLSSTHI